MNLENIQRLVNILNETPGITELSVTSPDGAKIALRKAAVVAQAPSELVAFEEAEEDEILEAAPDGENLPVDDSPRLTTVSANMVGIFHGANPPLGYGSSVSPGQIVGYIESMKLMNEVKAGAGGVVAEVLIEENHPVEYGQPLFRLTASAES